MARPPWGRSPDALPSFRGLGGDPGEVRSTPRSRFCRSCASRVRGAGHEFFPGVTALGRRSAADVRVSFLRRARTHVCLSSPSSRQSCRAPRPTWSSPTSALAPPRSSSDRATTGRRPSPGGSWKGRCVRSSRPRAGAPQGRPSGTATAQPWLRGVVSGWSCRRAEDAAAVSGGEPEAGTTGVRGTGRIFKILCKLQLFCRIASCR